MTTSLDILHRPSLGDKKLALLLDPEKADLAALPITSEVHPDYIFVGGSTGGDTTAFVRALKEYLIANKVSGLAAEGARAAFDFGAEGLDGVRHAEVAHLRPFVVCLFDNDVRIMVEVGSAART